MNKKIISILSAFLMISILTNAYLYKEKRRFEEAWLNQFITTSEIEAIFKKSGADISIKNIERISVEKFGQHSVKVVDLEDNYTEYGSDRIALGVNETLIFFKDGLYYGSKSNLANY